MTSTALSLPDDPASVLAAAPDKATFVLVALDRARLWLTTASDLGEVRELQAQAEAMRVYSRQAEIGRDAENAAAEIRLRAERRMGELLRDMPRQSDGGDRRSGSPSLLPTVIDLGLTRDESSTFQKLAAVPESTFEERLAAAKTEARRLSRAAVMEKRPEDVAFEELAAQHNPPGYDPTFDNEAVRDVGHLSGVCRDLQQLADRWSPADFADRYRSRRTVPNLLPRIRAAEHYLTEVVRHLEMPT